MADEESEDRQAGVWGRYYARSLDLITTGAPLSEVLEDIAGFAKSQSEGALASILLRSSDGRRLVHGAAPHLPDFYNQAIEGILIDQGVGSCGTAAYLGDTVIVADIRSHPYWEAYRSLAEQAGLRASWSEPIRSPEDQILGTFAMYYRQPRAPSGEEVELIRQAARVAALAIDRTWHQQDLRRAAVVFEQSPEGVMVTDADERILTVNRAFTRITGYSPEEVIGATPRILTSGNHGPAFFRAMWEAVDQGGWQGEIRNRRKSGEVFPAWASITPVRDETGAVTHYIGMLNDISEHKAQTARIEELAFYDSLTGLPNRELFMDRLRQALAAAHRRESGAMLLFMDLNDFKEINDSQGHDVGDRVLVEVASRFRRLLRESETLARFGGDEFAVIAEGASQEGAVVLAERLQQSLAEPVRLPEGVFSLEVSIGIVLAPADGESPEELIKNADIAMYRAKAGGGGHHFYQTELGAELNRRVAVTSRLSRALEEGGLVLYYQPNVDLRTGEWIDAEALLRWFDPEWGTIPPAEFVPLAEGRGLAASLGEWVLREASRQLAAWQAEGVGHPPGRLAVNMGVRQLEEPALADRTLEILGESGLAPEALELELTEGGLMANVEQAIAIMETLAASGVTWSIDDFGTGYSSLTYLKRFPATKVKIDKSFVRDMLTDPNDYAIVSAIVAMGHNLGLKVVAEGVETADQAQSLRRLGCDLAQGFYFAYPQPPTRLLRVHTTPLRD